MKNALSYWAAAQFEAARRLAQPVFPENRRRLHGHSFRLELRSVLDDGWGGEVGLESHALQRRLQSAVAALDYRELNEVIDDPSDSALLQWVASHLDGVQVSRLHLWAGPARGMTMDARGTLHGWWRDRFEAAHRLPHVPEGHKCGRMHGHGFEVVLHVESLAGDIRHAEGVWETIRGKLHMSCLNEVAGLEIPTSENLSRWIWEAMVRDCAGMTSVAVFETAGCGAVYDGRQHHIWKDFHFDSATRHPGGVLHGHTYALQLGLTASVDQVMGWAVDFGDVKTLFKPVFRQLDHHPLHERVSDGHVPALLQWIHQEAASHLPALDRIVLRDTPATGGVLAWREEGHGVLF